MFQNDLSNINRGLAGNDYTSHSAGLHSSWNQIPYVTGQIPFANQIPFATNQIPFGANQIPFTNQIPFANQIPFGANQIPFGANQIPFGTNPFACTPGMQLPIGANPYSYGNPYNCNVTGSIGNPAFGAACFVPQNYGQFNTMNPFVPVYATSNIPYGQFLGHPGVQQNPFTAMSHHNPWSQYTTACR